MRHMDAAHVRTLPRPKEKSPWQRVVWEPLAGGGEGSKRVRGGFGEGSARVQFRWGGAAPNYIRN